MMSAPRVDHPAHYGGADNPYEAIKVIESWQLSFNLGNTLKYICRAGKKVAQIDVSTHSERVSIDSPHAMMTKIEDLKKARWYLDREIQNLEKIG